MKQKFAFDKVNFLLIAIGMVAVVIGFLLMTGPSSTHEAFEPDIFSVRRIKVAPVICLAGFVFMIYAVIRKPKGENLMQDSKMQDSKMQGNKAQDNRIETMKGGQA